MIRTHHYRVKVIVGKKRKEEKRFKVRFPVELTIVPIIRPIMDYEYHDEDTLTIIGLLLGLFISVMPRLLFPVSASTLQPMVAEVGLTAIRIKMMAQSFANLYNDLTLAQYNQLQEGMHLAEVEHILGVGIEIKHRPESASRTRKNANIVTYAWYSPNGAQVTITFEDFILTTKEQVGLEV